MLTVTLRWILAGIVYIIISLLAMAYRYDNYVENRRFSRWRMHDTVWGLMWLYVFIRMMIKGFIPFIRSFGRAVILVLFNAEED